MNEQPPASNPDELIEPERRDLESTDVLDTARIVQDTESLTVEATPEQPVLPSEAPEPARGLNVLAVISLLLGLTASPLTVIFGYLAVGQVRRAHQRGEALAWTAVGLGWFWLVAWVVAGVIAALIWFEL